MPYCQCPLAFWFVSSSCPDWTTERCQTFGMCERIILSPALFQQRYRSHRLRGWSVAIVSLINKLISSLKPAASLQGQGSSHILTTLLPFSTSYLYFSMKSLHLPQILNRLCCTGIAAGQESWKGHEFKCFHCFSFGILAFPPPGFVFLTMHLAHVRENSSSQVSRLASTLCWNNQHQLAEIGCLVK